MDKTARDLDYLCGGYPDCGLSSWGCNRLQDIVYEDDVAKRREWAVELRKDQAEVLHKQRQRFEEMIDEPVEIWITKDMIAVGDLGEDAAKHFDYFRSELRDKLRRM